MKLLKPFLRIRRSSQQCHFHEFSRFVFKKKSDLRYLPWNHGKGYSTQSSKSTLPSPLEGVRVLDLTRILAGPYCTMILGDLGAEIIKVEKPGLGDDTRSWGPPFIENDDLSCYFVCVNRNKKSIAVDMKKGRGLMHELVKKSDVFIENYVPGTLKKLGLDYETLKEINPRLIYCSITGYGPDGPYAHRGGYDVIAASLGGLLHITGSKDGEPCKVGVAMTDLATGLYAHGAILVALMQRNQTNLGQKIDCNLLSTQIASLVNIGSNFINSGIEAQRWGTAHENIVPYQAFQTKDDRWITIGTGNNDLFQELCQTIGLQHILEDDRFKNNVQRVKNREILIGQIQERIRSETCEYWLQCFEGKKFPYGPINDMKHAFSDPQVRHNHMVHSMGPYKMVGPPVMFSGSSNIPRLPPPKLGQHTSEVLQKILGYNSDQISELYKGNIVQ